MQVTEVALTLYSAPNSPIVAFADVTLDDALIIRGIVVVEEQDQGGRKKLRIRMPSKPMKDGKKKDILYILKKELFMDILKQVLDYYDDATKPGVNKEVATEA